MILCLKCKRLWPKGTVWCGHCRATLGKRLCEQGHESLLAASACTTCGSRKLTPSVSSINLRPLTALLLVGAGALVAPAILVVVKHLSAIVFGFVLAQLLPSMLILFLLSWIVTQMLGKKGGKLMGDLCASTLTLLIRAFVWLLRTVASLFKA